MRQAHDTAFAIASKLTECMASRLQEAEQQAFHKMVYEIAKAAILRHDRERDRERERVDGRER